MQENPNNWKQYRLNTARSWEQLIAELDKKVTEPSEILQFGFQNNGSPFIVTRPTEEKKRRSRQEKTPADHSPPQTDDSQQHSENGE